MQEPLNSCGFADPLTADAELVRRVRDNKNCRVFDRNENRWRVVVDGMSNAVQFDPDWSSYWWQHLRDVHAATHVDFATAIEPLIFMALAADFAGIEFEGHRLDIEHTPQADGGKFDCAHCSVDYPKDALGGRVNSGIRRTFRNLMSDHLYLVHGDPQDIAS